MNSRDYILNRIKKNKPSPSPLPEVPDFTTYVKDKTDVFSKHLIIAGGLAVVANSEEAFHDKLKELVAGYEKVYCTDRSLVINNVQHSSIKTPHDLSNIDLAVIKGTLGVAENGAVWVDEKELQQRVLPFICQHLILVIDASSIVENMHVAYNQLNAISGYGVFIAGPSKTADIEQSLVVGAHGAKSLIVLVRDY